MTSVQNWNPLIQASEGSKSVSALHMQSIYRRIQICIRNLAQSSNFSQVALSHSRTTSWSYTTGWKKGDTPLERNLTSANAWKVKRRKFVHGNPISPKVVPIWGIAFLLDADIGSLRTDRSALSARFNQRPLPWESRSLAKNRKEWNWVGSVRDKISLGTTVFQDCWSKILLKLH